MNQPLPNPNFILQNPKQINHLLFSVNNQSLLFCGNRNGDINIYDLNTRRSIYQANLNKEPILCIVELNENQVLIQTRNGCIFDLSKLQEANSWNFKLVYQKESYTFCQFCICLEKNLIYFPSSESGVIDCMCAETYSILNQLRPDQKQNQTNRGMLMNLKLISQNSLLAGFENGQLVLFDLNLFKELASSDLFNGQPLMCFDYCSKKNLGLAGSSSDELKQFELKQNSNEFIINQLLNVKLTNPGVNSIKIRSSDSLIVACGCWDSRVRLYAFKKLKLLAVLDFHKEAINTIDFSLNKVLCSGSNDGIISFWSLFIN